MDELILAIELLMVAIPDLRYIIALLFVRIQLLVLRNTLVVDTIALLLLKIRETGKPVGVYTSEALIAGDHTEALADEVIAALPRTIDS